MEYNENVDKFMLIYNKKNSSGSSLDKTKSVYFYETVSKLLLGSFYQFGIFFIIILALSVNQLSAGEVDANSAKLVLTSSNILEYRDA
jgi:hypothetical protein